MRWSSRPGREPISPNNVVRRWIVPACTELGLERATWLTFRRTYSSWAHAKGVPAKVIAQLMGHAKVDTTLNIYTQVVDGSLRTAADIVGSELFTNRKERRARRATRFAVWARRWRRTGLVPSPVSGA